MLTWGRGASVVVALGGALLSAGPASGQGETAGMITEMKVGSGSVEVKAAGAGWRPATPLNTLRPGDQVRTSGDATAVVLLTGGRGTVRVGGSASPYVVPGARAGDSVTDKARALLSASLGFLSTSATESPKALLSTRGGAPEPEILTPRDGPLLPGSVVFEWLGSQFSRYTVRVLDPSGVVLEKKGGVGARFIYPPGAPLLRSGVRYRFQVEAHRQGPYETWFEVVDPSRASAVRRDLEQLRAALGPGVSASSLATVEAGALAAQGLFHDARQLALEALARDPDEPALHVLLGNLYLRTGLPKLAAQSLDEAQFLLSRDSK